MLTNHDVAGMVTLYNSPVRVWDNVKTYLPQVDVLFVIDNSDVINIDLIYLLKSDNKICYYCNCGNKGIANALNKAVYLASQAGYKYLLTMDDDSQTPAGLIDGMLSFIEMYGENKVGIVSAVHSETHLTSPYKVVLYTMTSGNLLNLAICNEVGGFWEDLFIDHVDHEYCLKLNNAGYVIAELPQMKLIHTLGLKKQIFNRISQWSFVSHNPERIYYMIRNGILVSKRHFYKQPYFAFIVIKLSMKEITKTIFFEDRKSKRFSLIARGLYDAINGFTGKLSK